MEYCAGGDLSKVIQNCRKKSTYLDESFIWKVFAQSVLALKVSLIDDRKHNYIYKLIIYISAHFYIECTYIHIHIGA